MALLGEIDKAEHRSARQQPEAKAERRAGARRLARRQACRPATGSPEDGGEGDEEQDHSRRRDRSGLDEQAAGQQRHARCNKQRQDAGARDIREPHRAAG